MYGFFLISIFVVLNFVFYFNFFFFSRVLIILQEHVDDGEDEVGGAD